MRKSLVSAVILLVPLTIAWSLGKPESGEFQPVEGRENWEHRFDISELPEGKYNLVVRGSDQAGNVAYGGPYNVFVDPDSDLPVAHVSNPAPGQKVAMRLNVVGTCLDDDAVQRVEVQLDDGALQTAEGRDLWSLLLDLSAAAEGEHTVSVRGVDSNGTTGKLQTVRFNLDRQAPVLEVTSHASGALVGGKVTLEGQARDGNGVASLAVSTDGGQTSQPVKLDRDKSDGTYRFAHGLDTKDFADGPLVVWFRATDRLGSTGQQAFLLFVNNEPPVLEILSPQQGSTVNGRVMVVGRASDKIGLAALRFEASDGQSGTTELVAGNPYWVHSFDLSSAKAGNFQITFALENRTGNRSTQKLALRVDPEADLPRVGIAYPPKDAQVGQQLFVAGFLLDDDGGASVDYALDGGAAVRIPAAEAFRFELKDLKPGRHSLGVTATDLNGLVGKPAQISFAVLGPPPTAVVTGMSVDGAARPYSPGASVSEQAKMVLSGEIRFAGGAIKAEASIGGGPFKSLTLKRGDREELRLFDLPLPKEIASGRIDVTVRATDGAGRVAEHRCFLYRGTPSESEAIVFSDSRIGQDGVIRLTDGVPLQGFFGAGSIAEARLDPPVGQVAVTGQGTLIAIRAAVSGFSEPTLIRVTGTDGRDHEAGPFRFITDAVAPQILLSAPTAGAWVGTEVQVEGTIEDDSPVNALEYSVGGAAPYAPLPLSVEGGVTRFTASISLEAQEDGPLLLLLRAVDAPGSTSLLPLVVRKDTTPPQITLITPRAEDPLNGLISLAGVAEDAGRVVRVEFTDDGQNMQSVAEGPAFRYDLNLSLYETIPGTLALRATDAAGNSGLYSPSLRIDREADRPRVEIQIPTPGEKMRSNFSISGMAFDDDEVGSLAYRLDGGEFVALGGGNNFSIPIDIEALGDNEHTVEVKAVDVGGLESELASATFVISTSEPESLLSSPRIDEVVSGGVLLRGTSSDPNGIEQVSISFDNGHSFQSMTGTDEWQYPLDTHLVGDGTVALLIQAVDRTGARGMFTTTISVDNQAPDLQLDSPRDGAELSRALLLDGRVRDNLKLASLTARLTPAGPTAAAPGTAQASEQPAGGRLFDLQTGGVFSQEVGIDDLPVGWYNLMLEAADQAGNRRYVARNVRVLATAAADRIELLHPAPGAVCAGPFAVTGRVLSQQQLGSLDVIVDGETLGTAEPNDRGYFSFEVEAGRLADAEHELRVQAEADPPVASESQRLRTESAGGWIRITSHSDGDFVTGRPYLEGESGYLLPPADAEAEETNRERQERTKSGRVQYVQVSFDNGKSFRQAAGKDAWRFRLETQELPNGPLRILVKATFAGGEIAVTNAMLFVDTRAPELTLLAPQEGGRFNESILALGGASDNEGLKEVTVSLREGDKSRYAVPKFIQGMYLDVHAAGATWFDTGLGLTFFEDNVKLQLQAGISPPGRFSGLVIGAKLLANILAVPFSYFFGPSWDFFSMSLAVGANFSYFTMSGEDIAFTPDGLVLGAMVAQLEFARFRVPQWRMLNTYSLYTEFQLWFISSDVEGGLAPRLSGGLRIGLL